MFSGNPGTGKTYHIVKEVILPELLSANPRKIFHNIRLKPEVIECELLRPTALHDLVRPVTSEWYLTMYKNLDELRGSLIIIDEVQNVFNSGRPMSDLKLVEFFTTHRHHCIDIVLGTQENSNINKVVRSLIEVDNRFYKLKDKTGVNAYRVETWYKDDRKATGTKKRFYDPEFFKYYSSYAQGAVSAGLAETPVIPKNNVMRYYLVLAGLALLFVFCSGYSVYSSFAHKSDKLVDKDVKKSASAVPVVLPHSDGLKLQRVSLPDKPSDKEIMVPLLSGGYSTLKNSFRVSGLAKLGIKFVYTLHVINSETEDGLNENFRVVQYDKKWEVGQVVDLELLKVARLESNPNFVEDIRAEFVSSASVLSSVLKPVEPVLKAPLPVLVSSFEPGQEFRLDPDVTVEEISYNHE